MRELTTSLSSYSVTSARMTRRRFTKKSAGIILHVFTCMVYIHAVIFVHAWTPARVKFTSGTITIWSRSSCPVPTRSYAVINNNKQKKTKRSHCKNYISSDQTSVVLALRTPPLLGLMVALIENSRDSMARSTSARSSTWGVVVLHLHCSM